MQKVVSDLQDGDRFSLDNGRTWFVCVVPLFGNVAVYVNDRRDDDAPTIRIPADRDATVLVEEI